ncbi:outer membrane protein with beta-barrel domain [Neolewinella xylanilytica]|uniref:Outer membrane protein with beta-barrel domain n=1 Tax=Neolewinella xylanilytica TaxID=1514080 RepID=A0A2S6I6M3_9BACT|nr:porin family protein [Neolewinella xylanilytica]PPK87146.1 outer membrane protein with beta-barrel domain [Neolewinella xylanilytica]
MKKLILPYLFLLSSLSAVAQYNPIQFGIQLSPAFSYLTTDNNLIESDGTNLGIKLGLMAEYYFQDNYSIHTGLNVHFGSGGALRYDDSPNGFEYVDIWREALDETFQNPPNPNDLPGATFDYSLQYVEIPLGLTLRTREFGYVRYFVRPSIALGINTSSRGSLEGVAGIDDSENFKIGSAVNALNLSWGIGGGVEYAISTSSSLIGGIGFQSGFLDVTTDNDTDILRAGRSAGEDNSRGKLNSIVIMLGIMF